MERQISLRVPETLFRRLDRLARKNGIRRSELIRRALAAYLQSMEGGWSDYPYERVRHLAGSVSGGPPDLGERHREYLKELFRDRR